MMTPGKQRGLDTLATARGVFAILALDHRDSLRELLPGDENYEGELTDFKLDLIRGAGNRPSGIMLEPELSLPQAITSGALRGDVGFTAALEAQGYLDDPWEGPVRLMTDFTALDAKKLGVSAAKLLLPYAPERLEHAEQQERILSDVAGLCGDLDLALMVEPVAFGMAPHERTATVVESVRRLTTSGVDLLKLEFPGDIEDEEGWAEACQAVTEAATVPWVLLSSGVAFAEYVRQLEVAFTNGCSGFTGGRAIWGGVAIADRLSQPELIAGEFVDRLDQLRTLADEHAKPWRKVIDTLR